MARIVPAKPACADGAEESALLALEQSLGDDFVILQRGPLPGVLLVLHPDQGVCALACVHGMHGFDPDAEAWDAGDPADVARSAGRALASSTAVQASAVTWFADMGRPQLLPQGSGNTAFSGEEGTLAGLVAAAMKSSRAIGEAAVGDLIKAVSPSATAYQRGQVTDAQLRWRETRGAGSGTGAPLDAPPAVGPSAGPLPPQANRPAELRPYDGPDIDEDNPLVALLRQAAQNIAAQRPIFVQGIDIDPEEMTSPAFLLPALLVAAAQDWAPVVVSKEGRGGFLLRLRTDPNAILGYRVAALEPSAPLLLMLPVVDRIRRSAVINSKGDEVLVMDETVDVFRRWLAENGLDTELIGEVDMRMAMKNE